MTKCHVASWMTSWNRKRTLDEVSILLLQPMIQNFSVTLSNTLNQMSLHSSFPGKNSLLLCSGKLKKGKAFHVWGNSICKRKKVKGQQCLGKVSDLVFLKSQKNLKERTSMGRSDVSPWDAQLGFGNGETFGVWRPRRELIDLTFYPKH